MDTLRNEADSTCLVSLKSKLNNLENWSKKNSVNWNIPKGTGERFPWLRYCPRILTHHMQLEGDLHAYQTNTSQSTSKNTSLLARPLHVCLLCYTDNLCILCNTMSTLKDNNPFLEANLFALLLSLLSSVTIVLWASQGQLINVVIVA